MIHFKHEGKKDIQALRELYTGFLEKCASHNLDGTLYMAGDNIIHRVFYDLDHDRVGLGSKRSSIDIALRQLARYEARLERDLQHGSLRH